VREKRKVEKKNLNTKCHHVWRNDRDDVQNIFLFIAKNSQEKITPVWSGGGGDDDGDGRL